MAKPLGSLIVRIGADTRGLDHGTKKATSSLGKVGRNAKMVAAKMALMTSAAAAAGASLTVALTKQGLAAVDAQAKLARNIGGTIDGLRGLQIAAGDAGVSSSVLETSMEKLNSRIGEARRGTGTAAKSFERLGLDVEALASMDVDERLAVMADRMNELGMSSDQVGDELRQLGIRNGEMIQVMQQGGDAIRAARQEVDDYGLSLSEVDAAKVEAANDAMSRIGRTLEVVRTRLAVQFAPVLEALADKFNATTKEAGGFRDAIDQGIQLGFRGFSKLADVVHGLRVVLKGVGFAFQAVGVGIIDVITRIQEGWTRITEVIVDKVGGLIRLVNSLPGPDIPTDGIDALTASLNGAAEGQKALRDRMHASLSQTKQEMQELAMQEMPSEGVNRWLEEVREKSQQAAEAAVEARKKVAGGGGEEQEAEDEAFQARLEAIRNRFVTEQQLLSEHQQVMADLKRAFEEGEFETEEEYRSVKEQAEADHMRRMESIRRAGMSNMADLTEAGWKEQADAVWTEGNKMLKAAGQISDDMFKGAQIAGAAQAFVSTLVGQAEALKLGYPQGLIAAAKVGAAGFGFVASIKSASKSGSGAYKSTATSAPSEAAAPATGDSGSAQATPNTVINLHGGDNAVFSGRQVRELIESINNELDAGMTLRTA